LNTLYDKGAAINAQDADKDTPLHEACVAGNMNAVRWLVEHSANTTLVNKLNQIPLAIAIKYSHAEIVEYLENQPIAPGKNVSIATELVLKNRDFITDNGSASVQFKQEFANLSVMNEHVAPFKNYYREHEHTNVIGKTPQGVMIFSVMQSHRSERTTPFQVQIALLVTLGDPSPASRYGDPLLHPLAPSPPLDRRGLVVLLGLWLGTGPRR